MNPYMLLIFIFLLSGCDTHIVKKEFLKPQVTSDWEVGKGRPKSLTYKCNNFEVTVAPIQASQEILTVSLFWIALIPSPWYEKKHFETNHITIYYSSEKNLCAINDLHIVSPDGSVYRSAKAESLKKSNALQCNYHFDIPNGITEKDNIVFSTIENCTIPSVKLGISSNLFYENHFQAW